VQVLFGQWHASYNASDARIYLAAPFATLRVAPAQWCNLDAYEVRSTAHAAAPASPAPAAQGFTPLVPGSTAAAGLIERSATGAAVYGWKAGTPPLSAEQERSLVAAVRCRGTGVVHGF
jgi:hypothetical protein